MVEPYKLGDGPSPFPKPFEDELSLIRADLKLALEPDKPLFEYANYVLRALAWWVATALAYNGATGIHEIRFRVVAFIGLGLAGLFGLLLTYRILMINRTMSDLIAYRYHQHGRWGATVAFVVSSLLLVPFATLFVLIWAALAHLGIVWPLKS